MVASDRWDIRQRHGDRGRRTGGAVVMHVGWSMGQYGVQRGTVGDVELFSLTRSTRRGSTDWELRASLPGLRQDHTVQSEQVGKATAEKLLRVFLERIGACMQEDRLVDMEGGGV